MSIYRKLLNLPPPLEPEIKKYNVKTTTVKIEMKPSCKIEQKVFEFMFTGFTYDFMDAIDVVTSEERFQKWIEKNPPGFIELVQLKDRNRIMYAPISDVELMTTRTEDHWVPATHR